MTRQFFILAVALGITACSFGQESPPAQKNKTEKKGNKIFYYDSKDRLISKRRKETFFRKGYAQSYDTLGQVTAKGHLKLSHRHGHWKILDDGKYIVKHYKVMS